MKVLANGKEEMVLIPENLNDLWYLYNRLDNLTIEQRTLRTKIVKKGRETLKGKKIPQIISIKAEKKKWEGDIIRVTGRIVSESERNKHHSLEIELDKKVKIYNSMENLPKEEDYEILICVVDKEGAEFKIYKFGRLRELNKIPAKRKETEFHKEVATYLNKFDGEILIAGPGRTKEKVIKLLNKEIVIDNLSSTGEKAFNELLGRGSIRSVLEKLRGKKEEDIFNRFFIEMKKNPEKVFYGSSVEENVDRIKEILVLSSLVEKYEKVLKQAEENGAKIEVVNNRKDKFRELRKFEIIGLSWW